MSATFCCNYVLLFHGEFGLATTCCLSGVNELEYMHKFSKFWLKQWLFLNGMFYVQREQRFARLS